MGGEGAGRVPTPSRGPVVERLLPRLHPLVIAAAGVALLTLGWLLGLAG